MAAEQNSQRALDAALRSLRKRGSAGQFHGEIVHQVGKGGRHRGRKWGAGIWD